MSENTPVSSSASAASAAASASLGLGMALAVLGAFAFSGKAIVVKLAYRHGADAVTLLMYRMLLALPFFAVMAWWAGRGRHGGGGRRRGGR